MPWFRGYYPILERIGTEIPEAVSPPSGVASNFEEVALIPEIVAVASIVEHVGVLVSILE